LKRHHLEKILGSLISGDKPDIVAALHRASAEETGNGRSAWGYQLAGYAQRLERTQAPKVLQLLPSQAKASLDSFQERVPIRTLEEVVAPQELLEAAKSVVEEHAKTEKLAEHNLAPTLKILLLGPPGCGKTMLAEAIAHATGKTFHILSMGRLVQSLLGNTIRNIEEAFAGIAISNGVFLLDEFDALSTQRQREGEITEMRRALNSLLIELDRFNGPSIVVAATNHPDSMDAAFRRRFQAILQFSEPELKDTTELTRRTLARHKFDQIDAERLAKVFQTHRLSLHETEQATRALLTRLVLQGKETLTAEEETQLKAQIKNREDWRLTKK
jgi:SpoVK/Ycf46/Vps4 family AAA+-type ATPase